MAKKRTSLGKGLEALLGEDYAGAVEPASQGSSENEISVADISPDREQPRKHFDQESIEELAASIRQQGIIQPIIVRPAAKNEEPKYHIIAGERRWRAAQKAGLKKIPVIIRSHDAKDSKVVALLENIQREDLNPIEIAQALSQLNQQHQLSHNDIAEALGMSRPAVSNLIRLAELQPSIKNLIHQGQLDMGHARAVLSVEQMHRIAFARHIASKQLTVRQAEALAKQWPPPDKPKQPEQADADIADFARKCSEALSVKVSIDHKPDGKGRLTIHYDSLEQLHHVTAKLSPQINTEQELTEDDPT